MTTKTLLLACAGLITLLLTAACGGDSKKFPETLVLKAGDIEPVLVNSELTSGKNRFAVGLFDGNGLPIVDAEVHFAFYLLSNGNEDLQFEMDAVSRVPARDAGLEERIVHVHADGSRHDHFNVGEQIGIYTAIVDFPTSGEWGVELKIDTGEKEQTLRPRFRVSDHAITVPIGQDAPRTRNLTINDVTDITQLDTSANPSPDMHTSTIADAIAAQRPVLILFAAPGYCTSQLCGPEFEIMRKLFPQYKDRVEFIHVEAYKNPTAPQRELVDAAKEWGLQSEPWFFVVGKDGKVAMKFEGPTSQAELEDSLKDVLG
ncbi:MAG TPA: hypothetical protein VG845_01775 [Dehalococcoidia bacterium]|nr:hypothetical protein [Dehalococcoidia bacterium]